MSDRSRRKVRQAIGGLSSNFQQLHPSERAEVFDLVNDGKDLLDAMEEVVDRARKRRLKARRQRA